MIKLHVAPHELGLAVGAGGNPEIIGVDKQAGIIVAIEVDSKTWSQFLQAAGRLRGVGIQPASMADVVAANGSKHAS